MISASDGERAVRLARRAIERAVGVATAPGASAPDEVPPPRAFHELRGVFVTLKQYPGGELRGCIGYPLPLRPLGEGIREVAVAAATEDPRFPPVAGEEMDDLTVEVSVLTLPEAVPGATPERLLDAVRPGQDGLIVEGYGQSGLLLPQVAAEQRWDARELLEGTCAKAGLPPDAWRDRRVRVRRFEAQVFGEERPRGPIVLHPVEATSDVARAGR